jgi:hypothetical protein
MFIDQGQFIDPDLARRAAEVQSRLSDLYRAGYEYYPFNGGIEAASRTPETFEVFCDMCEALSWFMISTSEIRARGGRQTLIAQNADQEFRRVGFKTEVKSEYATKTIITADFQKTFRVREAHRLDARKGRSDVELQWNSKDVAFARDVQSFNNKYRKGLTDIGYLITRATELQPVFKKLGVGKKYGASTTHVSKLIEITDISQDVPGACPIIVFAITEKRIVD